MEVCDLFRRQAPASLFPFFLLLMIDPSCTMQLHLQPPGNCLCSQVSLQNPLAGINWTGIGGRYLFQVAIALPSSAELFLNFCHFCFLINSNIKLDSSVLVKIIIPSNIIIVGPIWPEWMELVRGCYDVVALVGKHPLSAHTSTGSCSIRTISKIRIAP